MLKFSKNSKEKNQRTYSLVMALNVNGETCAYREMVDETYFYLYTILGVPNNDFETSRNQKTPMFIMIEELGIVPSIPNLVILPENGWRLVSNEDTIPAGILRSITISRNQFI